MGTTRITGEDGGVRAPAMTADQARLLGQQELFERLEHLVIETRGNIAEIARRLGKDRSTVRYHLRRFGMLETARPSPGREGET